MFRFDLFQKINPKKSAPFFAAQSASSTFVIPQIFTKGFFLPKSQLPYSIHITPFLFFSEFCASFSNAAVNSFAFSGFLAAASPRRIALNPIEAANAALLAERIPLSKVILASCAMFLIFENIFAGMSISIVKSFKSRLFTPHKIFL